MLDVIILAQTEMNIEDKVNMITCILCEKIHDLLVEDNTNIIQLIIHQAFPLNLVDILIDRVESFHVAIGFIQDFLMRSLSDLDPIFSEDTDDEKKEDDMNIDKESHLDLHPEHYKAIYRTVFFYRILAKLSERYILQDLQEKARNFILEVGFKYTHIL